MTFFRRRRDRREIRATLDAAMDVVVWEVRAGSMLIYSGGERIATIERDQFPHLIEQMARELGREDSEV